VQIYGEIIGSGLIDKQHLILNVFGTLNLNPVLHVAESAFPLRNILEINCF